MVHLESAGRCGPVVTPALERLPGGSELGPLSRLQEFAPAQHPGAWSAFANTHGLHDADFAALLPKPIALYLFQWVHFPHHHTYLRSHSLQTASVNFTWTPSGLPSVRAALRLCSESFRGLFAIGCSLIPYLGLCQSLKWDRMLKYFSGQTLMARPGVKKPPRGGLWGVGLTVG